MILWHESKKLVETQTEKYLAEDIKKITDEKKIGKIKCRK